MNGPGPYSHRLYPIGPENQILLRDFIQHLERADLRPGSIESYWHRLRRYGRFLDETADKTYLEATREDVEAFLGRNRERGSRGHGPLSSRTKYSFISAFSVFYQWAIDEEIPAPTRRPGFGARRYAAPFRDPSGTRTSPSPSRWPSTTGTRR